MATPLRKDFGVSEGAVLSHCVSIAASEGSTLGEQGQDPAWERGDCAMGTRRASHLTIVHNVHEEEVWCAKSQF